MPSHQFYMSRCLHLAAMGFGAVAPNPMVGAVLVYQGRIIAEGYHHRYGTAHAEVDCITRLPQAARHLLPLSTLYVNLEPCSHHGKTPPCADMIIAQGIRRVVIGASDPNPLVSGRGIAKLKADGIEVIVPILEQDCHALNKRFYTFHQRHRPYIILKWAQSRDGYMAPTGQQPYWLTSDISRILVHRWRAEEQAILIGATTAIQDDSLLTARLWQGGTDPIRILIDPSLRVPATARLFAPSRSVTVYNSLRTDTEGHISWVQTPSPLSVAAILTDLYSRGIVSVLVEGGRVTLDHFIASGLWDEARVLTAPVSLGAGLPAPVVSGSATQVAHIGIDTLQVFIHSRP